MKIFQIIPDIYNIGNDKQIKVNLPEKSVIVANVKKKVTSWMPEPGK